MHFLAKDANLLTQGYSDTVMMYVLQISKHVWLHEIGLAAAYHLYLVITDLI